MTRSRSAFISWHFILHPLGYGAFASRALSAERSDAWRVLMRAAAFVILSGPTWSLWSDMLVVMRAAVRRFLGGRDPYAISHVPWEAPLPCGPLLWPRSVAR